MATDFAPITPAILHWAREASGYSLEDVAKKMGGVRASTVAGWEDGLRPITLGRLELLARIYKRPTAIFFGADVPAEEDFRKAADFRSVSHRKPPPLLYQLRHAKERHDAAVDLASEAGIKPAAFDFSCATSEKASEVGERLRSWLNVDHTQQQAWSKDASGYAALNAWKDAIEGRSVLVFQASKRDLSGCRGFSVYADVYPVVVVSSLDAPVARSFTLMHELTHLGLRQTGVCDLHDGGVESFCNRVAAAALMPASTFAPLLRQAARKGDTSDVTIGKLARSYSVSEQALVLRMLELGLVDSKFYARMRDHFDLRNAQALARSDEEKKSVVIPQHTLAIARNGREFTRLVLEAYHRRAISAHRASRYLEVSFQFLRDIERDMARHPWKVAS
jgi:Zn-dependent peptidase ImmA (M78 family)/transcriptional regulator with XRE-family HTH domain